MQYIIWREQQDMVVILRQTTEPNRTKPNQTIPYLTANYLHINLELARNGLSKALEI